MGAVDHCLPAHVCAGPDQQVHWLHGREITPVLAQPVVQARGGCHPAAGLVHVDIDHISAFFPHGHTLLAEGHQQVLGQPPVQEAAGMIDLHTAQRHALPHLGTGGAGGGDGPVLGVVIEKHVQRTADLGAGRHFQTWQKNLAKRTAVEIDAEGDLPGDSECVESADSGHKKYLMKNRDRLSLCNRLSRPRAVPRTRRESVPGGSVAAVRPPRMAEVPVLQEQKPARRPTVVDLHPTSRASPQQCGLRLFYGDSRRAHCLARAKESVGRGRTVGRLDGGHRAPMDGFTACPDTTCRLL